MKKTAVMLFVAVLVSAACGSSSRPSSVFNGTYDGRLSGVSCVSGETLSVVVRHTIEAIGDEDGDSVELIDAEGNLYRGQVSLFLSEGPGFYGFSLGTAEENELIARSITYNFYTRPEGEPSVSMLFRQTVLDAASEHRLGLSVAGPAGDGSEGGAETSTSSSSAPATSSSSSSSSSSSDAADTCEFVLSGQLSKERPS